MANSSVEEPLFDTLRQGRFRTKLKGSPTEENARTHKKENRSRKTHLVYVMTTLLQDALRKQLQQLAALKELEEFTVCVFLI